jgi:soluble lytic murein transglycosylase
MKKILHIFFIFSFLSIIAESSSYPLKKLKNIFTADIKPMQIDEKLLAPIFNDAEVQNAVNLIKSGKSPDAISILEKLIENEQNRSLKIRLKFLLGYAHFASKDFKSASKLFLSIKDEYKTLADRIISMLVDCFVASGQTEDAMNIAAKIGYESPVRMKLDFIIALEEFRKGNYAIAAATINPYFMRDVIKDRDIMLVFGKSLDYQKQFLHASKIFKSIIMRYPLSAEADEAKDLLQDALKELQDSEKKEFIFSENQKNLDTGRNLFNQQRNEEAVEILKKVAASGSKEAGFCEANYLIVHALSKLRKHGASKEFLDAVEKNCAGTEFLMKSLFFGGRSLYIDGKLKEAEKSFKELLKDFPKSSYCDDAMLYLANIYKDRKDRKNFEKTLREQLKNYPDGDMAEEAFFLLVWDAYQSGNFDRALKIIAEAQKKIPLEKFYYSKGRLSYWKARIFEKKKNIKNARSSYIECMLKYPFSWYAILAAGRMKNIMKIKDAGKVYDMVLKENTGKILDDKDDFLIVKKTDDITVPSIASAIEFIKLGLTDMALTELKNALNRGEDSGKYAYILASLLHRTGMFSQSHSIFRNKITEFENHHPKGAWADIWKLAYPQAYNELVRTYSEKNKVEEALVWAVMREESAFVHDIESWANAVGLMQLIIPTAKAMAKGTDIQISRETLSGPAVNISLGTRYLSVLLGLFREKTLVVASYNAGEANVQKWIKRFKKVPNDEFVEMIPARQTRLYAKRVMSSYAIYKYLYENKIITVP